MSDINATEPDLTQVRTRPDRDSTRLSIRVFQDGLRFSWTLKAPSNEVLGRGTAETERQARIDALQAGMIYIDRANGWSSPGCIENLNTLLAGSLLPEVLKADAEPNAGTKSHCHQFDFFVRRRKLGHSSVLSTMGQRAVGRRAYACEQRYERDW